MWLCTTFDIGILQTERGCFDRVDKLAWSALGEYAKEPAVLDTGDYARLTILREIVEKVEWPSAEEGEIIASSSSNLLSYGFLYAQLQKKKKSIYTIMRFCVGICSHS